MAYLLVIVGICVIMAVHELGHFFVARAFKMRVMALSIGIGPVLWSHKDRKSGTTYQIALLPLLAYVQIAGMNPYEEIDPRDKGSYANASWLGRFSTILAGPFANYLFAVVVFFCVVLSVGYREPPPPGAGPEVVKVGSVVSGMPADGAHFLADDEIVSIEGQPPSNWGEMHEKFQARKGQNTEVIVRRGGAILPLHVTPDAHEGTIGIRAKDRFVLRKVGVLQAARLSVIEPPKLVWAMATDFAELFSGRKQIDIKQVHSVVGVVGDVGNQFRAEGWESFFDRMMALSIYLAVFNLIPFPALDGARLAFLLYEFITRKRPNAKVETAIHVVGMLALLSLGMIVLLRDSWQSIVGFFG